MLQFKQVYQVFQEKKGMWKKRSISNQFYFFSLIEMQVLLVQLVIQVEIVMYPSPDKYVNK